MSRRFCDMAIMVDLAPFHLGLFDFNASETLGLFSGYLIQKTTFQKFP